jgi:hypothetical protein
MNRYLFTITLTDGRRVEARAVGETSRQALEALKANKQFPDYIGDSSIDSVNGTFEGEVKPVSEDCCVLQESREKPDHYVVTHFATKIVVLFAKGGYNETARVVPLKDEPGRPLEEATALREIGEFLALYHNDLL